MLVFIKKDGCLFDKYTLNCEENMDQQGWKLRLVILWSLQVLNYVAYILISYIETGVFGTLKSGSNTTPGAIIFMIMCSMIWISFLIEPSITRWPSIILGIQLLLIKVIGTVGGLSSFQSGDTSLGIFITEAWGLIAAGLIIWYGIKIPKKVNA